MTKRERRKCGSSCHHPAALILHSPWRATIAYLLPLAFLFLLQTLDRHAVNAYDPFQTKGAKCCLVMMVMISCGDDKRQAPERG